MRLSETLQLEGAEDPYVLKVVFMAGAGGTGKSKIAKSMFSGTGMRYVNQDRHLERLMKDAGEPLSRVGARYDLFKQAQNLKNKEVAAFGKRRAGLIIDVTGWEAKRVINPLNRFRALGYDVLMVFVRTTLKTALDRNQARERNVPKSFVSVAHAGSMKNMPLFRNKFGPKNFVIIDNDAEIDPRDWARHVEPKLHKIAMEFLSRPVKNPKGKAWLKKLGQHVADIKPKQDDGAVKLKDMVESRWARYEREQPLTEEFTSRYDALGIPLPDPKTMCPGHCEGCGVYPLDISRDDVTDAERAAWDACEAENPNAEDDKMKHWHFIECPDCKGTGKLREATRPPVRVVLPTSL